MSDQEEMNFDFLLDAFSDDIFTCLPDELDTQSHDKLVESCTLPEPINSKLIQRQSQTTSTNARRQHIKEESRAPISPPKAPRQQAPSQLSANSWALDGVHSQEPRTLDSNRARTIAKLHREAVQSWQMPQMNQQPQTSQPNLLEEEMDLQELLQIDIGTLLGPGARQQPIRLQQSSRAQQTTRLSHFSTTSTQSITSHHQSGAANLAPELTEVSNGILPTESRGFSSEYQAALDPTYQHAVNLDARGLQVGANNFSMFRQSAAPGSQRPHKRPRSQISNSGPISQAEFLCQHLWSQWSNAAGSNNQISPQSSAPVRELVYTCSYCSRTKPHPEMTTVRMQCECGAQYQDNVPRSHTCWIPMVTTDLRSEATNNDSRQQTCQQLQSSRQFTWVDHKVAIPPHALPSATTEYKFSPAVATSSKRRSLDKPLPIVT